MGIRAEPTKRRVARTSLRVFMDDQLSMEWSSARDGERVFSILILVKFPPGIDEKVIKVPRSEVQSQFLFW
jgi:hypothetical protein